MRRCVSEDVQPRPASRSPVWEAAASPLAAVATANSAPCQLAPAAPQPRQPHRFASASSDSLAVDVAALCPPHMHTQPPQQQPQPPQQSR